MSTAKTLALSLAATLILATHSLPSFADSPTQWIELWSATGGDDDGSLWDYVCSLLW